MNIDPALLSIIAILLYFFHGLNFGIDFVGGTLIEIQSKSGPADLAKMRTTLSGLGLGDVEQDDAAAKGWPTIMRLYARDDAQGAFIGPWIAKEYAGKNVVILATRGADKSLTASRIQVGS